MCVSTPAAFGYTRHVKHRLPGRFSSLAVALSTFAAVMLTMQIVASLVLRTT